MSAETKTGFAEVNGGRLYWEAAGEGEPLVFVHGFTLDTRMWDDQWDVFAEKYAVIRYDARGFGKSSLPSGPFSHQDDLRELLDQLGVATFHLVGLSMGGAIAVDYAVMRPADLRSLVLIDAAAGGPLSAAAESFRRQALAGGVQTAIDAWLADAIFIPARRDPRLARRLEEIVGDYSGWHWTAGKVEQIVPDPPAVERLASVTAPTLIIVGELDIPRVHDSAGLLAKIPGARKEVVTDAGHMANMEKPAEVNRLILDFLAGR